MSEGFILHHSSEFMLLSVMYHNTHTRRSGFDCEILNDSKLQVFLKLAIIR